MAFSSFDPLLPADTDTREDVYVLDRSTGVLLLASVGAGLGVGEATRPMLSADGSAVAFSSWANDLVPGDTNNQADVFWRDLVTATTGRASVRSTGAHLGTLSLHAAISGDGRIVGFWTTAEVVPGTPAGAYHLYTHDRVTGATTLVDAAPDGLPSDGWCEQSIALSDDGRWVAFASDGTNLVLGDLLGSDVFVRERASASPTSYRTLASRVAQRRAALARAMVRTRGRSTWPADVAGRRGRPIGAMARRGLGRSNARGDPSDRAPMIPVRSISVLMPTWQGLACLDRALAALADQRCALPWDVRVIDSGSTDGTWECLERWSERFPVPFSRARIDRIEFDHGDTRNLLAATSAGDLIVFLTQDAIPKGTDWLARLAANFADPRVGAAYCRNLPRPDARLLTKVFSANDRCYQAGRREVRLPDAETYARLNAHERRVLYDFNDVASAVRRELWELHPFPRTWFGEDVLLARAILEAGFTIVYDDEAVVEHSHDQGPEEMYARARIDGRFNAEWLDCVSVATQVDARSLETHALEEDARALEAEGLSGAALDAALVEAARLRAALFDGLHAGGGSEKRHAPTRMLPSPRVKVLYVVLGFPPDTWAGTEVYTLNLAREIQARGHEVVVLARAPEERSVAEGGPPDFSVREDLFEGLRVLRMTNRLRHLRLRDGYIDRRAEIVFRGVLEREKPDVVHFQHLIHMSASLVDVARQEGVATLLTLHDYWGLCARVTLIRPDGVRCEENQGAGCFLCVKERRLDQIHAAKVAGDSIGPLAELVTDFAGQDEYAQMMKRHEIVPAAYAAADLRVSPSRFLRRKYVETAGFDPHTLVFSTNGMRVEAVPVARKRPDPRGRVRFGYVGTLIWHKGVATLLSAIRRLAGRDCVLDVFGDYDPDKDAHHAELRALAGPNVVFRGRFDNARIAAVHAEIDVLVVPSIWFENAPITIHEAHLQRTPVVVSNIGGMAEFVRDGVDGLHFEVGDDADLAAKLARFLDEPGLVAALSRDFPRIKSIEEDAAVTEFRYRQLACLALAREPEPRPRLLVDHAGIHTVSRFGGAEQQGADLLLLRGGTGAAAEYDVAGCGDGVRRIRVEQLGLASERGVELGVRVSVDGERVGESAAFTSGGRDGVRSHEFDHDFTQDARRLRVEPLPHGRGETDARIARVQVEEPPRATPMSRA